MGEQDYIAQFREAMRAAGLETPDEIIADGKLHRCFIEGDRKGSENGWYILHLDERPAGQFGSWKTNQTHTWMAQDARKLTEREKKELEKRVTEQRRQREEEEKRVREAAAAKANDIWNASQPVSKHDYLARKGILPLGARVSRGDLVIPLRCGEGNLHSLQFIGPGGTKRFLTGGRVQGCFFTLSALKKPNLETICICEGYATGATIAEATGYPVAVAFNTGNLEHVARAIREKYPKARLIICADNDQFTLKPIENPGVHYAKKAAEAVGAVVAIPQFAVPLRWTTDWNDLHQRQGLAVVREQILGACTPKPAPAALPKTPDVTQQVEPMAAAPEPRGIRYPLIVDWPLVTPKGRPLATSENLKALLDYCGIIYRYNVIKKDLEISIPGEQYLVDTQSNDKLTRIQSLAAAAQLPKEHVKDYVAYLCGQHPRNPVADWITSKPWDGVSRLKEFYDTITSAHENDPVRAGLKEVLLKRWLVQAVAVAFSPTPISTYGVLVFTGQQHVGKTHWFKKLVPQHLGLTKDGLTLRPDDKDSVLQAVSFWLVELGELDSTFKRSEISQLKAFITNEADIVRPPYARAANAYQRRTAFFGSVNDEEFLADQSGNRRFWTIKVTSINYEHTIDMQQLWAEVYQLYETGEPYYLTREELLALNESNKDFELTNPMEELMRARYQWSAVVGHREMTATDVARELGISNPRQSDTRAIARAIKTITGKSYHWKDSKKVYHIPREMPSEPV